jgi:hypothetical protein
VHCRILGRTCVRTHSPLLCVRTHIPPPHPHDTKGP